MGKNKRATINDVSELSGFSITTVSRVINGNYPVSERTKKKVNMAIEELGFRPNLLARSLIQDKTQTIGILTPSIENLFFSEVIKGINQYVEEMDYRSFLCTTNGNPDKERELIDSLLNRSVDGIIVIDPRTKNIKNGFYEGINKRLPLVLINGYSEGVQCNFVLNDDVTGTLEALRYLVKQKCSHLGLLRGKTSHSYDLKEQVFDSFCRKQGIEGTVLRITDGNGLETVQQAKDKIIKYHEQAEEPLIDGLLCCNDFMAVGALNAAQKLGINVPDELKIIGFDNTIISQITEPGLTTVDHHMSELGETAARRMVELIQLPGHREENTTKISVSTNLIIRKS